MGPGDRRELVKHPQLPLELNGCGFTAGRGTLTMPVKGSFRLIA